MKIIVAIAGILLSCAYYAHAAEEGDLYGGLQYAMITYDEEGFADVEPTALVGRIGRFVNHNLAIEGRLAVGLQDDDIDITIPGFGTFEAEVEVDNLYGFYVVLHSDTRKKNSFYGILGVSEGELEVSIDGFSVDGDESGLSYGVGVNIGNINIEYMSYLDEDDFEATALSLGFISQFD